jgi:hypothetical protein
MSYRLTWTPEMIAALKSMRGQGVRLTVCARRIGVSFHSAADKAREFGIQGRRRREGHGYVDASMRDTTALRQRWNALLPAMRDALKRDADD